MRATNKDNNSALKRLIPAVAMLALSAVTLSTSTYAWFTMNKSVDLTGINMSATASGGIEIALASVVGNNITFNGTTYDNNNHPLDADNELGWKSSVVFGNYYSDIGKLKPASSADGVNFFDATDPSNGGKSATTFKSLTLPDSMAQIQKHGTFDAGNTTVGATGNEGFYVDIPVHLRTSLTGDGAKKINYKMAIKNGTSETNKELFKAVRVAFIDNNSAKKISGADKGYYGTGGVTSENGDRSAVSMNFDSDNGIFGDVTSDEYKNSTGVDSGLEIPLGSGTNFGHLDFTVRIWLEGESTYCFDKNSGQSWNIDMAFMLPTESTNNP